MKQKLSSPGKGYHGFILFALGLFLFVFTIEMSLLSLSEVSIRKVNLAKNRTGAESLAEAGISYYHYLKSKRAKSIDKLFPEGTLKRETMTGKDYDCRLRFVSPNLQKDNYFILDFYMRKNQTIRCVSTGVCEGTEISLDFK